VIRRLINFHGGLSLKQNKRRSTTLPVKQARIPKKIILPLHQHIGDPADPCVAVGDKVYKGQMVGRPTILVSASVHASTSGTVVDIGEYPVPHPSGLKALCVVIESDGLHRTRRDHERFYNYHELAPEQLREIIRMSGVVGLGGAGFPTTLKLDPHHREVETLILNGVECEPYITCDDMLMREQATEIIEGLIIMRHALQAKHCIIAIENNKPDAFARMQQAVINSGVDFIEMVKVPTVYPSGGEKQLIQILTGKEVPYHGLPLDIGIVCQNVGTAYAVCRAVEHGEPLISRYVTVAGSVSKSRVMEVLIGTPIGELIEECGGNLQTLNRVIMGGPMMGFALHDINSPVIKTTNCILAQSVIADVPLASRNTQALPCIRCGACAEVCPANLLPQQLYWYARAREFDKVQDYHLFDCIECGCCDYVCPSHIPLVQYFRYAKTEIWNKDREKMVADLSRARHEFHKLRLEREKQERAERHKKKRAAISTPSDEDKKKAMIQAAMERARAKREAEGTAPENVDNLTEEQQRKIDEVDARRAKNLQQQSVQATKPSEQQAENQGK
jgi:electron transport complex protein RnfC